jgi:hypothetical protein
MLEASIADLRRNSYILDDIYNGLVEDPLSSIEYGYKEVTEAKKWFLNNQITVYLPYRVDSPTSPCIAIMQNAASEIDSRASLADDGSDEDYDPAKAGKPVTYVVPQFTPTAYDSTTGQIILPDPYTTYAIATGMYIVAKSGKAYAITSVVDDKTIAISSGVNTEDFLDAYIIPQYQAYSLRRENAFLNESWSISVYASSDPTQALWLRQLVAYSLFRYREAYLEARGFEISSIQMGPIVLDPNYQGDRMYTAKITLSGTVPATWIKYIAPKFGKVYGQIKIMDGPKTPESIKESVKKQGWEMAADNFGAEEQDHSNMETLGDADENYLLGEDDE